MRPRQKFSIYFFNIFQLLFLEDPDSDLFLIFGVPLAKKRLPDSFIEKVPDSPEITNFGKESDYLIKFYDRYVDITVQPYDSTVCNFPGCDFSKKYSTDVRRHYLTHFKGPEYEKFVCPRCGNNYSEFKKLKNHTGIGRCTLKSDFPKESKYISECLNINPQQDPKSKKCSACDREFTSYYNCHQHFMNCVQFTISCIKCGAQYTQYRQCRLHYEHCDGSSKGKVAKFQANCLIGPDGSHDVEWNDVLMLDYIRKTTIPQLHSIFARFPEGSFGTIGMTKKPRQRFAQYRNYNAVNKFDEANPPIKSINELILFRCWYRQDAFDFEYLLQYHTVDPSGEFYSDFGAKMNPMTLRVTKTTDKAKRPHYVYFQSSKVPFTFSRKKKSRQNEPATSSSGLNLSSSDEEGSDPDFEASSDEEDVKRKKIKVDV